MPLRTGASPAVEGAVYLLLDPSPSTTDPPSTPHTSPASLVVRKYNAGTDVDNYYGDDDGGKLPEATGIEIYPFPLLLIPDSALSTL